MDVYLETERLLLRRVTPDDVDLLVELDSDPEVMRYITGGRSTPRDDYEREYLPSWLEYYDRYEGYGFFIALEKATGEFLGWFQLRPRRGGPSDDVELGYRLRRSAWGKGYAREGAAAALAYARETLGRTDVISLIRPANTPSIRVAEALGAVRGGELTFFGSAALIYRYPPPAGGDAVSQP